MYTVDEVLQRAGKLPAGDVAESLNGCLDSHSCAVVTAPPGAGKSTVLPLTMLCRRGCHKIIMLEPRRIAARQIAARMASILGESTGETVGYRVRFDTRIGSNTRIEVVTEGVLTRMIADDPTLDGIDTIIFDEFHERSLNSDLSLCLVRQTQQLLRPDLKIVIMSATINAEEICARLNAPHIECRGRMFPVETEHLDLLPGGDTTFRTEDTAKAVASAVRLAHRECKGSILAFLPGQGEITRCQEMIGDSLGETRVFTLYGNLSPEEQRRAIAPPKEGERKVVLATPIAETSITIEGVTVVVDSGLCRKPMFDTTTGLSRLETVRISLDMATQRTGRAGRTAPGKCYRLWPKTAEHFMKEQREPEITEADLAPMLLSVAAFGETDIESLPWIDVPPRRNIASARDLLVSLNAINAGGCITPTGKEMSQMPCHPRIARMIGTATNNASRCLACDIAAVIEEKDPMADCGDADITLRISELRRARRNKRLGRWQRIAMIADEYMRMTRTKEDNSDPAPEEAGLLLAYAYPERIAMSADNAGLFRMASGKETRIDLSDPMSAHEWIAVCNVSQPAFGMGKVFLAAPLSAGSLTEGFVKVIDNVTWNSREGRMVACREERVGKLVVSSKPLPSVAPEMLKRVICEAVKKEGMSMLSWSDEKVVALQRRMEMVSAWHPELELPDLRTEHLISCAEEWLPFYLEDGGRVRATVQELKRICLADVLWAMLSYDKQQEINRLAPTHIEVPTGSRIRLDYRQGADAPVLSVRLQECFGMAETPRVDGGKRRVLMELLSPGFKPVQLTQDLESFWQDAYFEVRKDMRRRYPKHSWPDNPLDAAAVKGVKRKSG